MAKYATRHAMHRYQTRADVLSAVKRDRLLPLDDAGPYMLHDVAYPYVKPATRLFVRRLSVQYNAACGDTLVITSAVRPARAQPWNSTPLSVHPTGIAVDLHKPSLPDCRDWLRRTLLSLERRGVLEATEEFAPPHFHVAVYTVPYRAYVAEFTRPRTQTIARSDGDRSFYMVRRGDTLWDIARQYSTSVTGIVQENRLASTTLQPGQRLEIHR